MMRETPRTFVGTVTYRLEGTVDAKVLEALSERHELLPGVRVSEVDVPTATLLVTAEQPSDRSDVAAALARLGCRVC